jgi:hypothetical protein
MTDNREPGRDDAAWLMMNEFGDVVVPSQAEFMAAMHGTEPKGYRVFEVKNVDIDEHGQLVVRLDPGSAVIVLELLENEADAKIDARQRPDRRILSLIEGIGRAFRRLKGVR